MAGGRSAPKSVQSPYLNGWLRPAYCFASNTCDANLTIDWSIPSLHGAPNCFSEPDRVRTWRLNRQEFIMNSQYDVAEDRSRWWSIIYNNREPSHGLKLTNKSRTPAPQITRQVPRTKFLQDACIQGILVPDHQCSTYLSRLAN